MLPLKKFVPGQTINGGINFTDREVAVTDTYLVDRQRRFNTRQEMRLKLIVTPGVTDAI